MRAGLKHTMRTAVVIATTAATLFASNSFAAATTPSQKAKVTGHGWIGKCFWEPDGVYDSLQKTQCTKFLLSVSRSKTGTLSGSARVQCDKSGSGAAQFNSSLITSLTITESTATIVADGITKFGTSLPVQSTATITAVAGSPDTLTVLVQAKSNKICNAGNIVNGDVTIG